MSENNAQQRRRMAVSGAPRPSDGRSLALAGTVALLGLARLGRTAADQCGWNPPATAPAALLDQPSCSLPLDEPVGSDPRSWAPWTHRPYCAGSRFCVYTNAMLPRRDGISIVTTPEIAASSMSLLEHTLDVPFSDQSKVYNASSSLSSPIWALRDVPGKGRGAIAMRRIAKDMVIMTDPAIMMAAVEYPADVFRQQVQDILRRGAEQLRDPERVLGLAQKGTPGASVVEDVLITNSFGVSVGGESYMGLFPELSRLNHDCHPNAFIHFSEKTLAMTVWSSRDIEPGQEITISYSDFGLTYPERQKTLRDVWGFECHCALCSAAPEERAASDERRMAIRGLRSEVIRTINRGDFAAAVPLSEKLLDLVAEEELRTHYGDYFEIPAQLYNAVGDLEKAEKYTIITLDELRGYGTPGAEDEVKIDKFTSLLESIRARRRDEETGEGQDDQGNMRSAI